MEQRIAVFNFSGIYEEQDFYKKHPSRWLDFSDLTGVNGFCDSEASAVIEKRLTGLTEGIRYIDEGNYHYLSYFTTKQVNEPFTLVVLDHHTDMKPSLFGDILSCGSWIKHVLDNNSNLNKVILIGVADELLNTIEEKYLDRVVIFPESIAAGSSMEWLGQMAEKVNAPVYLSIDKDAFSREEVITDWDQGTMRLKQLEAIYETIAEKTHILAVDICGEYDSREAAGTETAGALKINNKANLYLAEFFLGR